MQMILRTIDERIITAFGCLPSPSRTPNHNAAIQLNDMPTWHYFSRGTNMAMHDLSSSTVAVPPNLSSLLGLGMKFCPIERFSTTADLTTTLDHFRKDLFTKTYYSGRDMVREEAFIPKMHVESDWEPKYWDLPTDIIDRYSAFEAAMRRQFKKKRRRENNLLPHQKLALKSIASRTDLIVINCDKNLGPAVIDTTTYVHRAFLDHLDTPAYKEYSELEATNHMDRTATTINKWLSKHKKSIGKQELAYLRHHFEPDKAKLPVFYLTAKVHKDPWTTRPIVSCSGSLLFSIGVWVDLHLQKVATCQPSYIKSSKDLKDIFDTLVLPPNCSLFKADATAMYTNIKTNKALYEIGQYMHSRSNKFKDIPTEALTAALSIVMKNNVFRFGDTFWLQLCGTAMGTPPAPTYANLVFAIHENLITPRYTDNLIMYKRYIDDIFGIWKHSSDNDLDRSQWSKFTGDIGNYDGLKWVWHSHVQSLDYLDIIISIRDTRLHTTLFEKELNLYLYIPPHSAHPPGVLTGLILGNCHRIYTLCSDASDVTRLLRMFYHRLKARGYNDSRLLPLFQRAYVLANARSLHTPTTSPTSDEDDATLLRSRIFYHTKFHPSNPTSSTLQQVWNNTIIRPPQDFHISTVENLHGKSISLERMTVAYSRPPNLGNILSARNLHLTTGPPVSSYRK